MTNERKNITQPADWWAVFEEEAEESGQTLSEWIGEACKRAVPKQFRVHLSDRVKPGRKKSKD